MSKVRATQSAGDAPFLARTAVRRRLQLHGWTFVRDGALIGAAYFAAEAARFETHLNSFYVGRLFLACPLIILVHWIFNYRKGIHRRVWEYAGISDIRALVDASVFSMVVLLAADVAVWPWHPVPVTVVVVGALFSLMALLAARLGPRLVQANVRGAWSADRVLIVGAGQAGQLLVTDLLVSERAAAQPIGFLDDDPKMEGRRVHGLPVLGHTSRLTEIVREFAVDTIAVAIPSAATRDLDRILAMAQETNARIQILPSTAEVLTGRSSSTHLRDINLDTLLDRIPSSRALEGPLVLDSMRDRVVLVTGGAGSIGSELCRQLVALGPSRVLALDNNETGLFHLERELSTLPGGALLTPVLTSVTAEQKLSQIFERYHPDIVFHAAAYKHVTMLESSSDEAVFVNIKGTLNLCRCAARYNCERFVFVSTDKAVDPVNALGFSKRIGELVVRANQISPQTAFCCVRFGNVIGSRGSALPEFVRQIDSGGPVTVTDPEVERYFMTIPEAVSLVIQAGALAAGGELYMLEMGNPIKIADLVKRLIRLRGLRVGTDIEIVYTGLRPGEKLTEDLVFANERTRPTSIPSIHAVDDRMAPSLSYLEDSVSRLIQIAMTRPEAEIQAAMARIAAGASLNGTDVFAGIRLRDGTSGGGRP